MMHLFGWRYCLVRPWRESALHILSNAVTEAPLYTADNVLLGPLRREFVMKVLFALVAISWVAQADNLQVEELKNLPPLSNPRILVYQGPAFATVEPTVWIKFRFRSCAEYSFQKEVVEVDSLRLVKVKVPINQHDCFGPRIDRKYVIQLDSDFRNEFYILLNPLAPETKRVQP